MITEPKIEERAEQPYLGIRATAAMRDLPTVIPQTHGELFAWCRERGISPVGAPFIRYHIIDMAGRLEIEMGLPTATTLSGEGRIAAGVLPAGRYASLVYADVTKGIPANKALLDWGAAQGLAWDQWETAQGDAFGARLETFLTNPDEEPDMAKWETEVAIRLAS
ncbi:MAG: GyrI-like domain-containing protein [Thermomicrobiales bacterium]